VWCRVDRRSSRVGTTQERRGATLCSLGSLGSRRVSSKQERGTKKLESGDEAGKKGHYALPAVDGEKLMGWHDAGKEKDASAAAWEELSSSYGAGRENEVARCARLQRRPCAALTRVEEGCRSGVKAMRRRVAMGGEPGVNGLGLDYSLSFKNGMLIF
jgi:hypothetical protein